MVSIRSKLPSAKPPSCHTRITLVCNRLITQTNPSFSFHFAFGDCTQLEMRRNCGNKIVEDDEECDCGSLGECEDDACCDGITCKLKVEAECGAGLCCDLCKVSFSREIYCEFAKIGRYDS